MAINYPNNPNLNDTFVVANVTWTWDGTAWSILSTAGGGGGVTYNDTNVDQHLNTGSASANEILSWDGSDYTWVADQTGGGGGGGGGASSLNELSDVNLSNPQDGEVLKYSAGEWTNGTDATGGGGGSSAFTDLTDAPAGLTPAQFYESAITTFRVDNNSTTAYTFNSHYTGDNPTIYVISGTTVAFDLTAIPGHPFEIQDSTGAQYNTGLVHVATDGTVTTGSNAQGKSSGVLYWRIQESLSSPPNYRYQCTSHASMVGPITIKRLSTL